MSRLAAAEKLLPQQITFRPEWIDHYGFECEGPGNGDECPSTTTPKPLSLVLHLTKEEAEVLARAFPASLVLNAAGVPESFSGTEVRVYALEHHFRVGKDRNDRRLGAACCEQCYKCRCERGLL